MRQQIPLDNRGNQMLVFPLFPYTTPPMDAANKPSVQKTEAKPPAKAKVGNVVALSFRSPAAAEMYDMVKGSNPHTQGDTEVSNPAPYMTGMEESTLDGSFKLLDAKLLAAVCAWKTKSSQLPVSDKADEPSLELPRDCHDRDGFSVGDDIRRNNWEEDEGQIRSDPADGSGWNDRVGSTKANARGISDAAMVNKATTSLFIS